MMVLAAKGIPLLVQLEDCTLKIERKPSPEQVEADKSEGHVGGRNCSHHGQLCAVHLSVGHLYPTHASQPEASCALGQQLCSQPVDPHGVERGQVGVGKLTLVKERCGLGRGRRNYRQGRARVQHAEGLAAGNAKHLQVHTRQLAAPQPLCLKAPGLRVVAVFILVQPQSRALRLTEVKLHALMGIVSEPVPS